MGGQPQGPGWRQGGVGSSSEQEGDDGRAQGRVVTELLQIAAVLPLGPDCHLHKAHQREQCHCGGGGDVRGMAASPFPTVPSFTLGDAGSPTGGEKGRGGSGPGFLHPALDTAGEAYYSPRMLQAPRILSTSVSPCEVLGATCSGEGGRKDSPWPVVLADNCFSPPPPHTHWGEHASVLSCEMLGAPLEKGTWPWWPPTACWVSHCSPRALPSPHIPQPQLTWETLCHDGEANPGADLGMQGL